MPILRHLAGAPHDRLTRWLAGIATVALILFIVVLATRAAEQRDELWQEVAKGLLQVIVIGVLGTVLKLLADEHQAHRQRAEARDDFRRDKYRRLVAVTSELRAVPIFIRANRSVKTWNAQMQTVLKADAELRQIKHEIYSSSQIPDSPFPDAADLIDRLERMFGYTTWVAHDFAERKKQLDGEQRFAEQPDLDHAERDVRQAHAWELLSAVESVDDMVTTDEKAPALGRPSWQGFLGDETVALQLMTKASLPSARDGAAAR